MRKLFEQVIFEPLPRQYIRGTFLKAFMKRTWTAAVHTDCGCFSWPDGSPRKEQVREDCCKMKLYLSEG